MILRGGLKNILLILFVFLFSLYSPPVFAASGLVHQFSKTFGGTYYDYVGNMVFDASGNMYLTGEFNEVDVDFNPGSGTDLHSSNGGSDVYLTKFGSDGSYLWTVTFGGAGNEYGESVAIDGSNNLYITGSFNGTDVDFDATGGTDLFSSSSSDIYITKYSSSGAYVWTRTFGGASSEIGRGIAVGWHCSICHRRVQ